MAAASTLVFVYGTLKRGGSNHRLLADQRFVAEARTVPGYRLYHLGDYPGMIVAADDTIGVSGEIWSVDDDALARLDAFEGVHESLYRREPIKLLPPFADQRVETYFYAQSIENRLPIPNGHWPIAS